MIYMLLILLVFCILIWNLFSHLVQIAYQLASIDDPGHSPFLYCYRVNYCRGQKMQNQSFSLNLGWKALLKDLGMVPEHVLRRASLPADLLSRGEQLLSTSEYCRFWQAMEEESPEPVFGLRIVEYLSVESFDPPLFAALCSANMMQAVQRLAKYKQLMAPMALEIGIVEGGALRLTPRWLDAQGEVPYSLQVAELAFFVRLIQLATREPVKACHLTLPRAPTSSQSKRYQAFFGVAVSVDPSPAITFTAKDALRPFLTVNEGMWHLFEPDLRRRLSELSDTATTAERVCALLLELLPSSVATIDEVASRLAMSRRTLQRRLEDEGENFRALLNGTRERLARHYLQHTALSSGEIAFLLGFEDPNSFYRAFHDWTGQTPERIRQAERLN